MRQIIQSDYQNYMNLKKGSDIDFQIWIFITKKTNILLKKDANKQLIELSNIIFFQKNNLKNEKENIEKNHIEKEKQLIEISEEEIK